MCGGVQRCMTGQRTVRLRSLVDSLIQLEDSVRTKRKYLPIVIGDLLNSRLDGVVSSRIDPNLDAQEDADEDVETLAGTSSDPQDARVSRRLQ